MDAVRNLEVTFRSLGGGSKEKMQEDWESIDTSDHSDKRHSSAKWSAQFTASAFIKPGNDASRCYPHHAELS